MGTKDASSNAPVHGNCYAAVLDRAKVTVEQWDNHGQYRQTEADKSLNDPQIGEPDDVAIARALLSASEAANELEQGCKLVSVEVMRDIPQEWIKQYIDQLLDLAKRLDNGSAMQTSALMRADHVMDMVKAFHIEHREFLDEGKKVT